MAVINLKEVPSVPEPGAASVCQGEINMGKIVTGTVYNKPVMGGFRGCAWPSLFL